MPFPERDNAAMRHTARLHPNRRGDRYSVIFNDELIVSRSRDPECDAARALLAKGITGKLVMLDGKTRKPRTIIDIEEAAKLCVKEGPLRFAPFNESHPDRSSTSKAKFSDKWGPKLCFGVVEARWKMEAGLSRMASPRGNGVLDSLLLPPAGDVANVGGVLARFERAFKNDPTSLQNLDEWDDWLFHLYTSGDSDDANVQRAGRLGEEIHDYRENSCADEWVNDDCPC